MRTLSCDSPCAAEPRADESRPPPSRRPLDAATLLGIAGVLAGCLWALFDDRRKILALQALGAGCFAAHFALIGAGTATVTCAVASAQSLCAARLSGRALAVAYGSSLVLCAGAVVKTWQGLPSLLAAAGASLATVGRLQSEPQRMRWFFLACTLAWVGHNLLTGSVFGLVSDALSLAMLASACCGTGRRGDKEHRPPPMRCCFMADEDTLRRQAERHFMSGIDTAGAADDAADLAHVGNKPSSIHAKLDALVAEARGKLRRRA